MREVPLVILVVSTLTIALSLATFYDDEIALLLLDRDSYVWPLIEMTTPIATGYVITVSGHVLLYNALGMPIECTKRLILVLGSAIVCVYGIWSSMAECTRYALDIIYNAQHQVGGGRVVVNEQKQQASMIGLALIVFTLFCFSTVMTQIWLSYKKKPVELVLLQRGALMCLSVISVSTVASQQTLRKEGDEWYESGPNCPTALVHASNLFLLQLLSLERTSEIKVIQWWLASVFNVLVAMSQMCLGKAYCSDIVLTCMGSLMIVYYAIRFNRYTILRIDKTIEMPRIETPTPCKRKEVALQIANAIGDLMIDQDDTKLIDLMIISQRLLKDNKVVEQLV